MSCHLNAFCMLPFLLQAYAMIFEMGYVYVLFVMSTITSMSLESCKCATKLATVYILLEGPFLPEWFHFQNETTFVHCIHIDSFKARYCEKY